MIDTFPGFFEDCTANRIFGAIIRAEQDALIKLYGHKHTLATSGEAICSICEEKLSEKRGV